jgi:SAM-dependent methyltransferase
MSPNILLALQITLVGMGIVFAAILVLWLTMTLLTKLTADKEPASASPKSDSVQETSILAQAAAIGVAMAMAEQQLSSAHPLKEPPTMIVSAWQLGLDLSPAMLAVARAKLPGVVLHAGDMRTFELGRPFDVVACLFSGIGYVRSVEELRTSVAAMARHVARGGLLLIEPWFTPDQWHTTGQVRGSLMVDEDDLKVARFVVSETRGRFAVTPMHHLVGESTGVHHFVETHELFLATRDEYEAAFVAAGLERVRFEAEVVPRGAWVGMAG